MQHNMDAGDSKGNQMLQIGHRLSAADKECYQRKLENFLTELPSPLQSIWSLELLQQAFDSSEPCSGVYRFRQADKANDEILSSVRYNRAVKRVNHIVQVTYEDDAPQQERRQRRRRQQQQQQQEQEQQQQQQPEQQQKPRVKRWPGSVQDLLLVHHPLKSTSSDDSSNRGSSSASAGSSSNSNSSSN
jgi:hypothetical protein